MNPGELQAYWEFDMQSREIERAFEEKFDQPFSEEDAFAVAFFAGAMAMRDLIQRRIAARMTNDKRTHKKNKRVLEFREWLNGRVASAALARVFLNSKDRLKVANLLARYRDATTRK